MSAEHIEIDPVEGMVMIVHPEDVNLADLKARAAEHDATVVANPYVPRGQGYLIDRTSLYYRPMNGDPRA